MIHITFADRFYFAAANTLSSSMAKFDIATSIFTPFAIGEEFKSVTFSIVFQHSSKTLEDSDVNPIIDEIVNFAEKKFHAKLRV